MVDLDKSLRDSDIMDEMRNILKGEDKEEKPKAKLPSTILLTEEDLIKMLELEDDDLEEKSDGRKRKFYDVGVDNAEFKKVRKDTSYFCPDCPEQYGFCLKDCFKEYDTY